MVKQTMAILTLALMAVLSAGCCGKEVKKFNVTVGLDADMRQSLASRKVEVHLVGINEKQNERWENYSMTQYWQPGDKMRESVPTYKMFFDPTNSNAQTLSSSDKIWDTWINAGANRLYVVTLLPGVVDDAAGDKDPRRQIEPLNCYRWLKRDRNIEIKIQKSGVTTVSELRPAH